MRGGAIVHFASGQFLSFLSFFSFQKIDLLLSLLAKASCVIPVTLKRIHVIPPGASRKWSPTPESETESPGCENI